MSIETFDFVIVGGGAAGSILADRLSADGTCTVCLLEAGPEDSHPWLRIPAGFVKVLFDERFAWPFTTEPTAWTNGRRVPIPQGRVLGGSMAINGLAYTRGHAEDYDAWAAAGNPGWAHADVLPYFRRSERRLGGDDALRGRDGPVTVSDMPWIHPLCEAFIAGAQGLGMPRNPDYNGADQSGVGYFQRTIDGRWRVTTARSHLGPARRRANLSVRTGRVVTAIELEVTRAVGVWHAARGQLGTRTQVRARREVVVSAGAVNTPRLLQVSGIGAPELLTRLGVAVRHALPGVGENLSDHFSVRLVARVDGIATINELARAPRLWGQAARWLAGRPNMLALSASLVHWFWRSREGLHRPDLQGVFAPASFRQGYVGMLDQYPGMTCGVWQHRPHSVGHVRARSTDVFETPEIQPHYLEDERDRRVLLGGLRLARRLLSTPELGRFRPAETLPGTDVQSDDELLDFARRYGVSAYHVNGTARMGPASDPMAVVDAELRVHGLQGLRVVDASVMPAIPSGNTCAATMMIAEKAADAMLGRAARQ